MIFCGFKELFNGGQGRRYSYGSIMGESALKGSKTKTPITPGTWVFWDGIYQEIDGSRFDFAGLVASRVVCHTGESRLTLDAGSKGISRDIPGPPVVIDRPGLVPGGANEEHQPCEWRGEGPVPPIGEVILFAPRHICTTFYLYSHFNVVEDGQVVDRWSIECRHGDA